MSESAVVSVVRCSGYQPEKVLPAVRQSIQLLGGFQKFFKPGAKVFIKINHLAAVKPECAVTTHPVFLEAVLHLVKESGVLPVVGDDIEENFTVSGIEDVCRKMNVELVNLKHVKHRQAGNPENRWIRSAAVPEIVCKADCIINLPKLKTHAATLLTNAVKNIYGFFPFATRVNGHRLCPGGAEFSELLVDLYSLVKPHLNIVDAITGMEGEGPMAGKPVNIGLVIAGADAVAVDAVAGEIMGLKPEQVLSTKLSTQRELGTGDIEKIEIKGESIVSVRLKKISLPAPPWYEYIPSNILKKAAGQLRVRPAVIQRKCIGCSDCFSRCPAGAIVMKDKKAVIDYARCLGCLCCQEVCRQKAIRSKRNIVGNIIMKVYFFKRAVTYVLLKLKI